MTVYNLSEFTPESVREFREELGLTQTEFGEIIGVSQSTVSQAENDPEKLRVSYMVKVKDAFDMEKQPFKYVDPKDLPFFKRIKLAFKWITGGYYVSAKTGFMPKTFDAFVSIHETEGVRQVEQ